MKRLLLVGAAAMAACALAATPAQATFDPGGGGGGVSDTGTITVTGTVSPFCQVTNGTTSSTFTDTFNTPELATAAGTLKTGLSYSSANSLTTLKVVCSSAAPVLSIKATSMTTAGGAPSGYANQINFTAYLDTKLITGATPSSDTRSVTSTAAGATSTNAVTTGKYLQNVAGNVVVRADTFATPHVGDVLVAGAYAGSIIVNVSPY
ncbi:MAG: hypothetical protein JSR86_08375 [Proteobacteria bacterium]|nr:hypothetical protein [Pseudomonadota bacterium]